MSAPELSECFGGDDPPRQIANCTKIINDRSTDADTRASAYVYRARLYEAKLDWDKAIADYDKALELDADNADTAFLRGRAYANKGDIESAIDDYSLAIKNDPDEPEYRLVRGNSCVAAGNVEGGIVDFSGAITTSPETAAAYFYRGEAYRHRGNLDQAIADYGAAIRLEPKSPTAVLARAETYRAKGDDEAALADYTQAIKLDPKLDMALIGRAGLRLVKRDLDGAIADLNHAIELDPNNAASRSLRAIAYGAQGDYAKAIADHSAALVLEPFNAYRRDLRALAYLHADQAARGLKDADLAIAYAPEYAPAYVTRGLINEKLAKKDAAIADFRKALTLAPRLKEAREALTRLGVPAPEPVAMAEPAAASNALRPAKFDELAWLARVLDRSDYSGPLAVGEQPIEVRSGPAATFPGIGSARIGEKLNAIARVKYKKTSGCGIDGASAEVPWYKVRLSGGREGYVNSRDVVNEKQQKLLSQKALVEKAVAEYEDKNSGPLKDFAGVYDGLKECKTDKSMLDDPIMRSMMHANLMIKQVIWFEGNTMASVRFINPEKVMRGRLTFQRDFNLAEGGAIKLYRISYENGNSETLGFFRDKLVIDPKINGNRITYNYATRCSAETAMVEFVKDIYDAEIAAEAGD